MSQESGVGGFFLPAIYKKNQAEVESALLRGAIDYADFTGWTFADEFLCFTLQTKLLSFIDQTYPNPREKNEVPIWYLVTCQFLLRLLGTGKYQQLKFLLNSGSILTKFGFNVATTTIGFNHKNKKPRSTVVDSDTVRKFFKDTDPNEIRNWYNSRLQSWFRTQKSFDAKGLFVLDQSHIVAPDNPNYEDAVRMPVDEHGQLYKNLSELTVEQKKALIYHPCYTISTLLHVGISKDIFHIAGYEFGPGNEDELVQADRLIATTCQRYPGLIKELIMDRGYICGEFIEKSKKDYDVDSLLPLKTNMDTYKDAVSIAARENKWTTLELSRDDEGKLLKQIDVAEVRDLDLWIKCNVKQYAAVAKVTTWNSDEKIYEERFWVLGSTKNYIDPGVAVARYRLRMQTEERYRQFKYGWHIKDFPSPNKSLMESHVCFTLFTYSLYQLYLRRHDLRGQTNKMIQTFKSKEQLGQMAVMAFAGHDYGIFDLDKFIGTVAGLEDDPRAKIKVTMDQQAEERIKRNTN